MVVNTTVTYTDEDGNSISNQEAAKLAAPYYKQCGGIVLDIDLIRLQSALRRIQTGLSIRDISAELTTWGLVPNTKIIGWGTNLDNRLSIES